MPDFTMTPERASLVARHLRAVQNLPAMELAGGLVYDAGALRSSDALAPKVEAAIAATAQGWLVTADDVRAEAQRRIMALTGARDPAHLEVLIANASREAIRLLRKGEAAWTPEEAARAAALEGLDASIEAIRAASNAMEGTPPQDYRSNEYWL
jgi:hypothetical protein